MQVGNLTSYITMEEAHRLSGAYSFKVKVDLAGFTPDRFRPVNRGGRIFAGAVIEEAVQPSFMASGAMPWEVASKIVQELAENKVNARIEFCPE